MSYCRATKTFFKANEGIIAENQAGEKHLYSPYASFKYCYDCGKRLVEEPDSEYYFVKDNNEEVLCKRCEDDWYICSDCGYFTQDITEVNNGKAFVCDDCLEDYTECRECGKYFNADSMYETVYGDYVCQDCADNKYSQCEECGKYVLDSETYDTVYGTYICKDCAENKYVECSECGNYVLSGEACSTETGELCCNDCYERLYNVIRDYSYKPDPIFHYETNEETNEYFGFEIEVSGYEKCAKDFLKSYSDEDSSDIYLKHDSSVSGFEIVTHPMSRKWFYKYFVPKLTDGLSYLRQKQFRGHNQGGIHIHVSSKAINSKQLKRMILLIYSKSERIRKIWLAITQRNDYTLDRWASINPDKLTKADKNKKELFALIDKEEKLYNSKPYLSDERYTAINTQNGNTVEFRIFNSNLRIERIIKNAEVIFSLLDFTETDILPTMYNYLDFVEKNKDKYKYFYDFLIEKHIWQSQEEKEKLKTTLEKLDIKNKNELKRYIASLHIDENYTTDEDERGAICA